MIDKNPLPKTILVVEDFADIRTMMKVLLQLYGYNVVEASDGFEAVKKAIENIPDLILMDMAMPLMDGLEATAIIRERRELDDVPIFAVTAYGDRYAEKALAAGCAQVIGKPLDFETLKPLLNQYLGQAV